jgi:hypothetical protein
MDKLAVLSKYRKDSTNNLDWFCSFIIASYISLIIFGPGESIFSHIFNGFFGSFLIFLPVVLIHNEIFFSIEQREINKRDNEIIYCKYCEKSLKMKNKGHKSFQSRHCTSKKAKEYRKNERNRRQEKAKKSVATIKAAEARKRTREENKKNRKIAAFNNRVYQKGYTNPSMAKKESIWTESDGKCIGCRNKRKGILGFWWKIYPSLELVLLCDKCAKDENLFEESFEHNEKRSRSITEDVKDAVWRRDEGKCTQCGSNEDLEFDHIIPHSKGGANTKRNIQLLCEPCNRKKSDNIG